MPLYDFRCIACGRVFERLVRGDDVVSCPDCGTTTADRLLAMPARPARGDRGGTLPDLNKFGPPPGGGCCGGGCSH
ncbi:MAG: zinc ribbon domain-containing protein [Gemmatimonadales bacterium]|nr:zinc ribbon domain-containing protein [Gemmatimonadales bacterium]